MNKLTMIEEHLQLADEHVIEGEQQLVKQRKLIWQLERDGHDSTEARRLLRKFEELQAMHMADRDRLLLEKATLHENPN